MAKQTLHRTATLFRCESHTFHCYYRVQRPTTTVTFPRRLQNCTACLDAGHWTLFPSSLRPSDQPLPWHVPAEEQWWHLLRVTQDAAELAMHRPILVLAFRAAVPDKQALAALG